MDPITLALRMEFVASGLSVEEWLSETLARFMGGPVTVKGIEADRDALIASWDLPDPVTAMREALQMAQRQLEGARALLPRGDHGEVIDVIPEREV